MDLISNYMPRIVCWGFNAYNILNGSLNWVNIPNDLAKIVHTY